MSAPKSTRRRQRARTQQSIGGIADLGGMETPPHFPPLAYYPESDMRSTPNDYMPPYQLVVDRHAHSGAVNSAGEGVSSDEDTLDHVSQHRSPSPQYATWTPINDPSERPRKLPLDHAAFSLRNGYTLANAELRMNEIFEGKSDSVDRKDGLVYHYGHKCQDFDGLGASYSFVFLDDDPEEIPAQVQVWKDQMTKKQRIAEGPALEDHIRHMLETGSALIIERVGSERSPEGAFECILPECRYGTRSMPTGHFYLTLRPGRQKWLLQGLFCFCLSCFERLWKGEFSEGRPQGPAGIKVRHESDENAEPVDQQAGSPPISDITARYSNELTLDGTMDSLTVEDPLPVPPSLRSSRHAPPETSSPLRQVFEGNDDMANDSPRSLNSQDEWSSPTTRVQHLAAFFKPGKTLNRIEIAAVMLWKAASFDQLQWDVHQQKTRYVRQYHAGDSLIDRSLTMQDYQIYDIDGETIDEAALETIVKLPKSRFRGYTLGDVWLVIKNEGASRDLA